MNANNKIATPLIEFRLISLSFKEKKLFENYNSVILKNTKCLLTGRSGSGKTTLFKMILGFQKPDSGIVLYTGKALSHENIRTIRNDIFYLSQDIDFRNQIVSETCNDIMLANGLDPISDQDLNGHLSLLGLSQKLFNQTIDQLSGGERQRLGLLICFLLDRPVWLLDEPTAALDDAMKQTIADYILGQDKTILVISHDDVWKKDARLKIEKVNQHGS